MKQGDVVPPRQRELRIDAFPSGKDLWRIDWFGPIAFPDRAVRRRQPSVLVSLSKADPAVQEDPEWLLDAGMSGSPIKRWVSVGTLMLLRIGDVWSDKTRVMEPAYESVIFEDVEVSRHTATLVKAGAPLPDGQGYLLPMSEHPWHRDNTQSYCVKVSLDEDNCDLVIPCMELIRHYFGSSSELLSRLFTPPLTQERLFEHWHLDRRGGRMSLSLAEGVPGTSAEDVARVAASKSAWAAACLVGESCLRASVAGREIYPQARFPFEGRTQLAVKGKWLPHRGESRRRTFVVYQITSCWHPFPFGSLKYRTKGLTRRFMPPTGLPERSTHGSRAKKPKQPTLCEQDAGLGLTPQTIKVESQSRFPDLDEKSIWMNRPLAPSSTDDRPPMATSKAERVDQLAVGEPWSVIEFMEISQEVDLIQHSVRAAWRSEDRLEKTGVADMFADDDETQAQQVLASPSDVDRFWLTFLEQEPRPIDEDVFADILESTGWMPMDLQASLKRLIDAGRVINFDARGKRVTKPLHYKKAERLALTSPGHKSPGGR